MSCGTSPSIQHRQTISQNLVKASPLRHFRISAGKPPWPRAFPDASDLRGSFISSLVGSLYSSFRTEGHRACVLSTRFYGSESWGAYHLTENFGNSGWKVNGKVPTENWGVRFEVVRSFRFVLVNQTECCLPLTNFSVPSRFQTRATQIRPFLDSNRNGCSNSAVNWYIAYHYAFDSPNGFFCQMVSNPGLFMPARNANSTQFTCAASDAC